MARRRPPHPLHPCPLSKAPHHLLALWPGVHLLDKELVLANSSVKGVAHCGGGAASAWLVGSAAGRKRGRL